MKYILLLTAIFAGILIPLQAALNAKMARAIGDPIYASLISFGVGTVTLFIYSLITKVNLASIHQAGNVHWSVWIAGVIGALYVTAVIILAPKIGATLTFGLVIAGQLTIALALDHYGWLGLSVHPINWPRIGGILFIAVGVVLIYKF